MTLETETVFTRLLLHSKKKYAGLQWKSLGPLIKGMDLKRRDYCLWSKNIQVQVLQVLLHSTDTESMQSHLRQLVKEVLIKSPSEINQVFQTSLSREIAATPPQPTA